PSAQRRRARRTLRPGRAAPRREAERRDAPCPEQRSMPDHPGPRPPGRRAIPRSHRSEALRGRNRRRRVAPPPTRSMTTPPTASPEPWALDAMEVAAGAGVDPQQGLSAEEARRRLARHGPNQLRERRPVPAWRIFLRQFRGLVVALLFAAAVSSLAM